MSFENSNFDNNRISYSIHVLYSDFFNFNLSKYLPNFARNHFVLTMIYRKNINYNPFYITYILPQYFTYFPYYFSLWFFFTKSAYVNPAQNLSTVHLVVTKPHRRTRYP